MSNPLSQAVRDLAEEINALASKASDEKEIATYKKLDHAALALEVLAHVVDGKTVDRAFGAPGDWGYGTPIGDGLLAYLRAEPTETDLENTPKPGTAVLAVLAEVKERLLLAETACTTCHAAMLGKVDPKSPAWALVYAVQDRATKAVKGGAS